MIMFNILLIETS